MITENDRIFLDSFESCAMGSACWTHAAHVRIGWLILSTSNTFDNALSRLRSGIMRFNATKSSIGYHETITVAFARVIDSRRQSGESWNHFIEKNADLLKKSCLADFYSPEILKSARARVSFVEPDCKPLPALSFKT